MINLIMYMYMLVSILFSMLFIFITFFLSLFLMNMKQEFSVSFECGMEMKNSSRGPFSIRFFLFILLFLIFDMECLLIIHLSSSLEEIFILKMFNWLHPWIFIIFFLFIGVIIEKYQGALKWQE